MFHALSNPSLSPHCRSSLPMTFFAHVVFLRPVPIGTPVCWPLAAFFAHHRIVSRYFSGRREGAGQSVPFACTADIQRLMIFITHSSVSGQDIFLREFNSSVSVVLGRSRYETIPDPDKIEGLPKVTPSSPLGSPSRSRTPGSTSSAPSPPLAPRASWRQWLLAATRAWAR